MTKKTSIKLMIGMLFLAGATSPLVAGDIGDGYATLRSGTELTVEEAAPEMAKVENSDKRKARNYPEQPPTIPHQIRDYQVDLNANKCLSCHSRTQVEESQAPMVSVTHFMDRDGQVLSQVSPRRYFCTQCHVPQENVTPQVENEFIDVDSLLKKAGQ
ncbi:nitrate reductase cytochrome c-type subunit [Aestuariispira insulae]|uniref:Periplasmic nitrate reductase, electron transfer subunit n=1 Tax=Aestuariispira insulae TaxID=1461337 RepID=A0A3D9HRN4_9PROT|nr:nitrate reductase cytochrome c-type subunit [Aestuariispira insulae]RED52119.1 periplasmic nitrate reductase subunit NapB [Aestuariispira insulae]